MRLVQCSGASAAWNANKKVRASQTSCVGSAVGPTRFFTCFIKCTKVLCWVLLRPIWQSFEVSEAKVVENTNVVCDAQPSYLSHGVHCVKFLKSLPGVLAIRVTLTTM